MAENDLIAEYVDELRRSLRWRLDLDELLLELEDHLRSKAEARRLAGAHDPDRQTIEEFGSALEVARAFATTSNGGLAVPTSFTRRAGALALVAGLAWLASMVVGFVGQGSLLVPWNVDNYWMWSAITTIAGLLAVGAFVGVLVRTGGRLDLWTIAGLMLLGLAIAGSVIATWAWVVLFLPFSIAGVIVFMRLRSVGLDTALSWLLVAAWPVGSVLGFGLDALHFGTVDEYGDYPTARVVGFTVAATMWAVALAGIGWALTREEPMHLHDGSATA